MSVVTAEYKAALHAATWSVSILFGKMVLTAFRGAFARFQGGKIYNTEDAFVPATVGLKVALTSDMSPASDTEGRWRRIQQNDFENIFMYCSILILNFLVPGTDMTRVRLCAIAFTAARLAHTITYALRLQPFRSIAWTIGLVSTLGLAHSAVSAASAL